MSDVAIISLVLLLFCVAAVITDYFEGRAKPVWYLKLRTDMRRICKGDISDNDAMRLLVKAESDPDPDEIIQAYRLEDSKYGKYLIESTYSGGRLLVFVMKTAIQYPFFYIYGPKSDYDSYNKEITDQFTVQIEKAKVRVATQKGAGATVQQLIESEPEVRKLVEVLEGSGVDIEFSQSHVYVWDFYNDKRNLEENHLDRLLKAAEIAELHLAPRLEAVTVSGDMRNVAGAHIA